MTTTALTAIHNARLLDGRLVDIEIRDGAVHSVIDAGDPSAGSSHLDARGALILPSLVEPHTHLDKAYTSDVADNRRGDLRGAMDAFFQAGQQGRFGRDDCVSRATAAMWTLVEHGVTAVRTHVDVGVGTSFDHLDAVLEAARSFRDSVDVQVVALMYAPLSGRDGHENRRRLAAALERGVDAVGGAPQLEPDPVGTIEVLLDAASDGGCGLDLHLDETLDPAANDLEHLARRLIERGHRGRVTASHCVSLCVQPPHRQHDIARLVAEAGISVVALPQSNLYLQGRDDAVATPRGIAPVDVLRDCGVVVCAGGDNIRDPFNPLGAADPMITAWLLVVAGHQGTLDALDMVTSSARQALGLPPVAVEVGSSADFVLVGATDVESALATRGWQRTTIRRGRVLATIEVARRRF